MSSDPAQNSSESTPRPPSEPAVPSDGGLAPAPIAPEILELQARVAHLEQTQQEMRLRHLADLKALRQSQHLLNAILDNTTAMVFAKDTVGRYIMVNRRYEE